MSEWTVDTLKEFMDERFRGQEEALLREREERRERDVKNNEFRGQLSDQAGTFTTRAETEVKFKALEEQIRSKNLQIIASFGFGLVGTFVAIFNLASRLAG